MMWRCQNCGKIRKLNDGHECGPIVSHGPNYDLQKLDRETMCHCGHPRREHFDNNESCFKCECDGFRPAANAVQPPTPQPYKCSKCGADRIHASPVDAWPCPDMNCDGLMIHQPQKENVIEHVNVKCRTCGLVFPVVPKQRDPIEETHCKCGGTCYEITEPIRYIEKPFTANLLELLKSIQPLVDAVLSACVKYPHHPDFQALSVLAQPAFEILNDLRGRMPKVPAQQVQSELQQQQGMIDDADQRIKVMESELQSERLGRVQLLQAKRETERNLANADH